MKSRIFVCTYVFCSMLMDVNNSETSLSRNLVHFCIWLGPGWFPSVPEDKNQAVGSADGQSCGASSVCVSRAEEKAWVGVT